MTKAFCDRCGREADPCFKISLATSNTPSANQDDLCRDCAGEFQRWLKKSQSKHISTGWYHDGCGRG